MIAPENILDSLKCSQCLKYLSVGQVKVYPNREVKCGRCNNDDDIGVPSNLFNIAIKDLRFPCVNRFDGCNAAYSIAEMANHEYECQGGRYECYFCQNFEGIAYDLNIHCQEYHKAQKLDNPEFLIKFEKFNQEKVYFHSAGAKLFFIRYAYNADCKVLLLDVIFVGKCYKGDIFYSSKLYSIENDLLYKTRPRRCSIMTIRNEEMLEINIWSIKIPKRFTICKFYIHDQPELVYTEIIPTIDDFKDNFTLRCTFSNLSKNKSDYSEFIYPAVFRFMDIPWRIIIKKRLSLTDYKKKFIVYLQWSDEEPSPVQFCKVSGTFSIISTNQESKISKSFVKKDLSPGENCGRMLQDWVHIMHSENGFVKDDCLRIEVTVKIYIPVTNKVKCQNCLKDCVHCDG